MKEKPDVSQIGMNTMKQLVMDALLAINAQDQQLLPLQAPPFHQTPKLMLHQPQPHLLHQ
ncbi:MAG: hypothetical protein AAF530_23030 [Pseudomonadota bacterium]